MSVSTNPRLAYQSEHALNAVCPYFTMFPVEFPLSVLWDAPKTALVLDPFCGRGTTAYAARCLGLASHNIDSSPVAVAIARSKVASSSAQRVVRMATQLMADSTNYSVPHGEFWHRAYHNSTLDQLCRLRAGLLTVRESQTSALLRAILLGVLHGPLLKGGSEGGYLSNQMPRTFAPKPDYSVSYWRSNRLRPPKRDLIRVIAHKAERALRFSPIRATAPTSVHLGDSRLRGSFTGLSRRVTHVVTSPPYFGMRTYVQDQWLRNWVLGGAESVRYGTGAQISHASPDAFADSLAQTWNHVADCARDGAKMVVRFGSIGSRSSDPRDLLTTSLKVSRGPWRLKTVRLACPRSGIRRQSTQMVDCKDAHPEFDFYITLG
jgi:hypothetical protein